MKEITQGVWIMNHRGNKVVREGLPREVTFEHTGSDWVSHHIIWEEAYSRCETSKYKGSEVGRRGVPDMLKEHNVVGEQ